MTSTAEVHVIIFTARRTARVRIGRVRRRQLRRGQRSKPYHIRLIEVGHAERHAFACGIIRVRTAHATDEVLKLPDEIIVGELRERWLTECGIALARSAVTGRATPLPDRRTGGAL